MPAARPTLYASGHVAAGLLAIVSAVGDVVFCGTLAEGAALALTERAVIVTWQPDVVHDVLVAGVLLGAEPGIAMRGTGGGRPVLMGLRYTGGCQWQDGLALMPDGIEQVADWIGEPAPTTTPDLAELVESARRWAVLHRHWHATVSDVAGRPAGVSLGGTAAAAAIPLGWRLASERLSRTEPWLWLRGAYYGGRVECQRPGWQGQAVEYDLRSAYGWAMCQWLPGHKLYERPRGPGDPLWPPHAPGWADVTVRLSAAVLPVRQGERLLWPAEGQFRGVWTRDELDREGVHILQVHRVVTGRWTDDLRYPVARWLEARERTTDPMRRSILRGLSNSLAGKLCQRPIDWILWCGPGVPPEGAVPLAMDCNAWIVATEPKHWPIVAPATGSYVTSLVRSRMLPQIQRPDCIYTDTDSIHLPADAAPPSPVGSSPGDFAVKRRGLGDYRGVRDYTLGDHNVSLRDASLAAIRRHRGAVAVTVPATSAS